ncbi:MAG: restriction endonuclease [Chloroflexi bacterium]|nr:restriction endonuclease [Chloroflexota bacterium]
MSHHINYSGIGWEAFEDLCIDLWFDEGYKSIKPYGRRADSGRDAVFVDDKSRELTIFQFKRWTTQYSASDLKREIKDAAEKVVHFRPYRFILNSAQEPKAVVNDWIPELQRELEFEVSYWDRSWVDLRLDNRRHDLRRKYFGTGLEYHTWESLVATTAQQVKRALNLSAPKYDPALYVEREAESIFERFRESKEPCLLFVDRAGRGKTNLICTLASRLIQQNKVTLLITGDSTLVDDYSLARIVCTELGYGSGATSDHQLQLKAVAQLLSERGEKCYLFVDGISEADDSRIMGRSLRNLLNYLSEIGNFAVCLTCRDVAFPRLDFYLPKSLLFRVRPLLGSSELDKFAYQVPVGDFTNTEVTRALLLYSDHFHVSFSPSTTARSQLRHPLLLRLFCEANQNQSIGSLGSVPIASTFDHYLNMKIDAVVARTQGRFAPTVIGSVLLNIAKYFSQSEQIKSIVESQLAGVRPETIAVDELREIVRLLEEEGVLEFRQQPLTPERNLYIVFDELRDYLVLKYMITQLPSELRASSNILNSAKKLFQHFSMTSRSSESFTFFSLLGMVLPPVEERREFLRQLRAWDFQTFCACVSRIPPAGTLAQCDADNLKQLAAELKGWYYHLVSEQFQSVKSGIDPWSIRLPGVQATELGILLRASRRCEEISFEYQLLPENAAEFLKIEANADYPTWSISIGTDSASMIPLHDPENGKIISIFRQSAPFGFTKRTLNFPHHSPFAGVSSNIPERIALFDVLNEIGNIIEYGLLPHEAEPLITERARALARSIPDLHIVEGLTLDIFQSHYNRFMSQYESGSADHARIRVKFEELGRLL